MPFSVHQSAQRKLSPNNSFLCFFTILEFSALLTVKFVRGDKKVRINFSLGTEINLSLSKGTPGLPGYLR